MIERLPMGIVVKKLFCEGLNEQNVKVDEDGI